MSDVITESVEKAIEDVYTDVPSDLVGQSMILGFQEGIIAAINIGVRCGVTGASPERDTECHDLHEKYIAIAKAIADNIRLKKCTIRVDGGRFELTYTVGGTGTIQSFGIKDDDENTAIDGLESLILAQACAGVDVTTVAYRETLEAALDAIDNNT